MVALAQSLVTHATCWTTFSSTSPFRWVSSSFCPEALRHGVVEGSFMGFRVGRTGLYPSSAFPNQMTQVKLLNLLRLCQQNAAVRPGGLPGT